jgi:hypothetical protein
MPAAADFLAGVPTVASIFVFAGLHVIASVSASPIVSVFPTAPTVFDVFSLPASLPMVMSLLLFASPLITTVLVLSSLLCWRFF